MTQYKNSLKQFKQLERQHVEDTVNSDWNVINIGNSLYNQGINKANNIYNLLKNANTDVLEIN